MVHRAVVGRAGEGGRHLAARSQQALTLTQQYQVITGTLGATPITAGRLNGEEITFTAGSKTYSGRVTGDTMTGDGWSATRK